MTDTKRTLSVVSNVQMTVLVALRMIIGWHFLYEGVSKMLIPNWSSADYLESSQWIFSGVFQWIASNGAVLKTVDILNVWGLTFIGLGLLLGLWARAAGIAGILLLALYYCANPPFIQTNFNIPTEGHYLFINKNLVEMFALLVLVIFPTSSYQGLDRLYTMIKNRKTAQSAASTGNEGINRRELLKQLAALPVLGVFIGGTAQKNNWEKVNAITGATIKVNKLNLKDLKGELPKGTIGKHSISRVIFGSNLIGGWSHSRDLLYVSSLFKAYNSEKKVFETLMNAEQAGINTINIHYTQIPVIDKYKRIFSSKIQTVCQIHPKEENWRTHVDETIDSGVDLIQIQGNCCDWRVQEGRMDILANAIEHAKKQGYTAGLGAHSIQALMACDEAGIDSDFYMKTLHHDNYWSAHPMENRIPFSVDGERSLDHNQFHDNMFCLFPDKTIEFMENSDVPFMAFKVLAGGAIHPNEGFKFAFENGADFICVGMFDYQIIEDVNIAHDVLSTPLNRKRDWYA
jgi:uncharacterized membrane protein YphA (DoxX/SURF4 family)